MPKRTQEPLNDVVDVVVIQSDQEDSNSGDDDVIFVESVPSSSTRPPDKKPRIDPIQTPNMKQRTGKTPQTNPILLCPLSQPDKQCSLCKTDNYENHKNLHCHCGTKVKLQKGRVQGAEDHWKSSTSNQ